MIPGLAFALAAVCLWSTNAVAAKFALAEMSVAQVLALQFSAAAVTLLVMHLASGHWRQTSNLLDLKIVPLGIVGIVGTITFQYFAFRYSPIMQANIIAYGWPLYAALWWAVMRRSSDGVWFVVFAMIGFLGVSLIVLNGQSFAYSSEFLTGYFFALASALCMAFYTLAAGRLHKPGPGAILLAISIGAAATWLLALNDSAPWPSAPYLIVGAYIGIGPMALGYYLWLRAMSGGNPASLAQIGFATPLISTMWLLIAGETLGQIALLGAVFVVGASVTAVLFERARPRRHADHPPGRSLGPPWSPGTLRHPAGKQSDRRPLNRP